MKKLLVILMVVAMASFLFVGCVPTTPEEEVVEEEEVVVEEEVVAATVAPIITSILDYPAAGTTAVAVISLTSTATQYMNAAEIANGIVVYGTAPTYSEVKVYIDDICAGTADVGVSGTFSVVIAKADLGADGEKVIYATAKEAAIDVSAHSVEYAFVLDTVKPTAITLAATTSAADSAVVAITAGAAPLAVVGASSTTYNGTLAAGTWTVMVVADSGKANNVVISDGTTSTSYTIDSLDTFNGIIPGVSFTFIPPAAGNACTVTVTTAIADRATVLFDEAVTYASAMAATYTWYNQSDADIPTATARTYVGNTQYFTPFTANGPDRYDMLQVIVNGAIDLAGNTQTVANVLTCPVGAASLTTLAP